MNLLTQIQEDAFGAKRAALAASTAIEARMFARRLRSAIRDNVVSKRRAIDLLGRLNRLRRADDPWALNFFLNDFRHAMDACCRRYVLGVAA